MADLLRKIARTSSQTNYIHKLLNAFEIPANRDQSQQTIETLGESSAHSVQNLIEPLTDRELEVLQLIADGLSNQEIADALVIAEGTVKKHIHNIFGKLAVRRRTQVVLRARELGLL
jgi:LuxR family maltose regulon positive regulatory protein